jgi:transcription antitermination protein NusB
MPETKNTINIAEEYIEFLSKRRLTRIMAVQTVYSFIAHTYDEHAVNKALYHIINLYKNKKLGNKNTICDEPYLIQLVKGCLKNIVSLDSQIQDFMAKDWKIERISKVVQSILRVATFELLNSPDLTDSIIIDEYLEIAKYLNHDGESGFINSVLDQIAKLRSSDNQ